MEPFEFRGKKIDAKSALLLDCSRRAPTSTTDVPSLRATKAAHATERDAFTYIFCLVLKIFMGSSDKNEKVLGKSALVDFIKDFSNLHLKVTNTYCKFLASGKTKYVNAPLWWLRLSAIRTRRMTSRNPSSLYKQRLLPRPWLY